ncbi:5-methylcytosine restriction system specificity protein McrC [Bacillus sp. 179-C3.3 HS]|uniref:5-methylcytosine restriction system specificity protein McrC n=1 Tax=Bacillus sp. 179-C3.3 HS TaxID=3232162 RepID=UPI00399F0588
MEEIINAEGQNLINVFPDEIEFFTKFLEKKGITWRQEQKEASVIALSKSLTGYIKTPRRIINIEPKYREINIAHILRLYNYVYSYRDVQDDELLDINKSNQSQNIVNSFLKKLQENISIGILQDYFPFEQNTKYLKGNVDYVSTYKNIMKLRRYPVKTEVYTLSPNVDINRLIVGALQIISKSGQNSSEAIELLDYFNNVVPISENASEFLQSIHFNSKNIRYKKVASDAAMIIDSLYYDGVRGNVGGESFLINFDILFEKFVRKILLEETNERNFSVWKEPKLFGKEYLNGLVLSSRFYQPDILYKFNPEDEERDYKPTAEAVLDVKNKANGVFKNADIYQVMLYNQLLYAKKSILIYPSFFYKPSTIFMIENDSLPVPEIHSVFIDIASPDAETFKGSISNLIENIYEILEN